MAHRNGVTSIVMCFDMIISSSFDHYLVAWDYGDLVKRIEEKKMMREEDIRSRRIEVYYRTLEERNIKGKRGGANRNAATKKTKKGKK